LLKSLIVVIGVTAVNSVTPIYGSRDCSLPLIRLHNITFWGFIFFILFKSVTLYLIFLISAIIMLGSVDKTELGYYAAAVKLSEICDFWPLIIAFYI